MKLCLNMQAKKQDPQKNVSLLTARLPVWVQSPCELTSYSQVKLLPDYYLVELTVTGSIIINCQRCLTNFQYLYNNKTVLAVCPNDEVAERIMARYDCLVSVDSKLDIVEILTDDLHLFAPEKHVNQSDCERELMLS